MRLFTIINMKIKTILILLILATGILSSSCRSSRGTKGQRQAYQAEDQLKEDQDKAIAAYKEHHYDIQADQTREMINKSRKRNKQLKKSKNRESFVDRMFKRKRPKSCNGN